MDILNQKKLDLLLNECTFGNKTEKRLLLGIILEYYYNKKNNVADLFNSINNRDLTLKKDKEGVMLRDGDTATTYALELNN